MLKNINDYDAMALFILQPHSLNCIDSLSQRATMRADLFSFLGVLRAASETS